jgi:hypothetical protein
MAKNNIIKKLMLNYNILVKHCDRRKVNEHVSALFHEVE